MTENVALASEMALVQAAQKFDPVRVIAQELGCSIATGRFDVAVFPSEAEIASRYGVSRATARDAFKMLAAKGLVIPGLGRRRCRVAPQDSWPLFDREVLGWLSQARTSAVLLIELCHLRRSVEPAAAGLAAASASPDQRGAIEAALASLEAHDGPDEELAADLAFHGAILEASGNRFYRQVRGPLEAALRLGQRVLMPIRDLEARDLGAERRVADAIRNHDARAAESAMAELLDAQARLVEAAVPARRNVRYIQRYGRDA